ncbi:hypothetical protein LguiA_018931 [Lonicera macranthoides]
MLKQVSHKLFAHGGDTIRPCLYSRKMCFHSGQGLGFRYFNNKIKLKAAKYMPKQSHTSFAPRGVTTEAYASHNKPLRLMPQLAIPPPRLEAYALSNF